MPVPASRQEEHSFHWICPSCLNTHTHTHTHTRAFVRTHGLGDTCTPPWVLLISQLPAQSECICCSLYTGPWGMRGKGKQRLLSSYLRWEAHCGPSGARLQCQLSLSDLLRWPRARSGKGWVHFLGSAIPVGRGRKVIHMKVAGFCYHIYCDRPVWSLAERKQNAQWSLDERQNVVKHKQLFFKWSRIAKSKISIGSKNIRPLWLLFTISGDFILYSLLKTLQLEAYQKIERKIKNDWSKHHEKKHWSKNP